MSETIASLFSASMGGLSLSNVLSAAVMLLICMLVVRMVMKLLQRFMDKSRLDERVRKYILVGTKAVLYLISAIIVVTSLGIDMTSLVAMLSVASLGVTLAAEDILGNVAGGLVILSSHPFAIGDYIEAGGVSGEVHEISLNHTKLLTPDGLLVMIPNKELSASKLTNYTVQGRRRVTHNLNVSYEIPTEAVKAACLDAVAMTANVMDVPAPVVYLTAYGNSAITYSVRCWAATEHYWDVHFALAEHLRTAFARHGVKMTYDHLNVHIVDPR